MDRKVLVVIPARMGSSRYPGKPLAMISGMPMIERVWRLGMAASNADRVVIATDSEELAEVANSFGAEVCMTSADCQTGTDRVAETVDSLSSDAEIVLSLQGDSVLTPPWVIESVISEIKSDPNISIATPAVCMEGEELRAYLADKESGSSTGTNVVMDKDRNALYFSKALIPFNRDAADYSEMLHRHIGLYAYRVDVLKKFADLPQTPLEKMEQLEQLRALENGIPIRMVLVDYRGRTSGSVDRPEDVDFIERIISQEGELLK